MSGGAIATFIAYTLVGAKASPTWSVPGYEQIICSCDGGTRSVAVGGLSRCDYLPPTNVILQRGPAGTLLILDGGAEFCSYLLRGDDSSPPSGATSDFRAAGGAPSGPSPETSPPAGGSPRPLGGVMSSSPGSLCVVPFSSCTVVGLDAYVCNNSSGVLTVTWLRQAAYLTLTVYGGATAALAHPVSCPWHRADAGVDERGVVRSEGRDGDEAADAPAQPTIATAAAVVVVDPAAASGDDAESLEAAGGYRREGVEGAIDALLASAACCWGTDAHARETGEADVGTADGRSSSLSSAAPPSPAGDSGEGDLLAKVMIEARLDELCPAAISDGRGDYSTAAPGSNF